MKLLLFVLTTFFLLVVKDVESFPGGAGACIGGNPSVFGGHVIASATKVVVKSTLAAKKISVNFKSRAVAENSTAKLLIKKEYVVKVMQADGFKGVLIRVQDPMNATVTLSPYMNTQVASACISPAFGVTHTNSSIKTMASGLIRYDIPTKGVMFDINVVFANNATLSDYAYGRLYVDFNCRSEKEKCKRSKHCCGGLKCRSKRCVIV